MDIQFYGANCLTITVGGVRIVADDNLAALGGKSITRAGDIALFTDRGSQSLSAAGRKVETKLTIDHAGEYEVSDISIYGIPARSHMDEEGKQTATMYKVIAKELSVLITGHVYPDLSDSQLETVGMVDVMCIPVGGNGYTLDAVGALKLIKKIEPKILIPTHYDDARLKYEVPQQTLQQALHDLSMEPRETVAKLKLKASELPDVTQLVILEHS